MRVALWAFLLAVTWTVAVTIVARSPGFHSTPGMWTGVFGLPGVVAASWVRPYLGRNAHDRLGYAVMFLVNWAFYCTVIQGVISFRHFFSANPNVAGQTSGGPSQRSAPK
jgi:MFS-type transporter involved in bile tolerance (Atg22 family)